MGSESTYLSELAGTIGPRPATSDAEARAAEYIEDVMIEHGLDVERQEFDSPRTYSWAFIIYHILSIAAAAAALKFAWPAFAVALLVAIVMVLDLETLWGLSNLMPKGPSQNIIGRHVPKVRRGERVTRIVVVAHYDSAKASLAFSPSAVKNFRVTFRLMQTATYVLPAIVLAIALPFTSAAVDRWLWYAALVCAVALLIPLFINVHRELFMQATPGANDNASGVAAMLSVLDLVVPEREDAPTPAERRKRRSEPAGDEPEKVQWASEVIPDDDLFTFSPAGGSGRSLPGTFVEDEDIEWEDAPEPPVGQTSFLEAQATFSPEKTPEDPGNEPHGVRSWLGVGKDFDARKKGRDIGSWDRFDDENTDEEDFGSKGGAAGPSDSDAHPDDADLTAALEALKSEDAAAGADDTPGDVERDLADASESPEAAPPAPARRQRSSTARSGKGRSRSGKGAKPAAADVSNVTSETSELSPTASRIRRLVTTGVDRALSEKEVWFVATGAEEAGTWGMRALLKEHGEELRDALIINLDNLGAGGLTYITAEGMGRRLQSNRRLMGAAKRVVREQEIPVKAREYRLLSTDATPALARGYKAMSIMAFDINGRLPNWHWPSDTLENVHVGNVELAADFVTRLIKEL